MTLRPLNGSKTHPLSTFALSALKTLSKEELPRQEFNAGVVNRLERDGLVETIVKASPYKTHKGRQIDHIKASAAGLELLAKQASQPTN